MFRVFRYDTLNSTHDQGLLPRLELKEGKKVFLLLVSDLSTISL